MESSGGVIEENWFRISVCLERFFSDERARCFVSVSGARPVRWLRRRLRRLFVLPGRARHLALLSQGHLLPPDEPLALLRPDDVVHVIPTNLNMESTYIVERNTEATEKCNSYWNGGDQYPKKRKIICTKQQQNASENDVTVVENTNEDFFNTTPNLTNSSTENLETANAAVSKLVDEDLLREVKEKALALLDTCAPAPLRRRRLRRRRPRRPQTDLSEINNTFESEVNPDVAKVPIVDDHLLESYNSENGLILSTNITVCNEDEVDHAISPRSSSPMGPVKAPAARAALTRDAPAPCVLQNEAAAPRAARLVRPLQTVMIPSM